jgi:hypothetical protein
MVTPAACSQMKALAIAAATAIALAMFAASATIPVVAHADPRAGGLGTDQQGNQCHLLLPAQNRISTWPAVPEPAPSSTAAPPQTPEAVPPSLLPPSTLPMTDGYQEPTEPWWPPLLRYGVLLLTVGLIAWRVGLCLHRRCAAFAPQVSTADSITDLGGVDLP